MFIKQPDERTKKALARLQHDPDFREVLAWLEHSNAELDRAKRQTMDGVMLRMQQGAAAAVGQFIDFAQGKSKTTAIAPARTTQTG